ncbi:MAG: hypothetical protein V3V49_07845 [Candidatus Krumholzibacteria bacterium]
MLLFRCTKKLLHELRVEPDERFESDEGGFLGSWFAHLLRIERRKCVLFTNSGTLYSFLVVGLRRPEFQNFRDTFVRHLLTNLSREGLDVIVARRLAADSEPVAYAKTNNRSVLGSMNELAFLATAYIEDGGGLESCDLLSMNYRLNRTPMSALQYRYPIEALKAEIYL